MSAATPGANELCGLCRDIGKVANAVSGSTMSADEEDAARLLLTRARTLLERQRDWSRGGQRSGPYEAAGEGAASVTERVEPASSAAALTPVFDRHYAKCPETESQILKRHLLQREEPEHENKAVVKDAQAVKNKHRKNWDGDGRGEPKGEGKNDKAPKGAGKGVDPG